ncbi:MAG: DUF1846 domain-containing protein [Clostridia bacterium]
MKVGFDCDKYLKLQTKAFFKRAKMFNNKLYIEFGGKLFDDFHGSRVLPGFLPDIKIKVLEAIKDKLEIIFCVNAEDIEKNRIRGDSGLSYDLEVLRSVDALRGFGLYVSSIVITLFSNQPSAVIFAKSLENKNEKVYFHTYTKGYPSDVKTIVSEQGYGKNPYIKTTKPFVLVTAPGARSGKLATCLSQLYHEYKMGINAGYTKYETFPVWNLPLKHPINLAYEAATADIKDTNMIDPYYLIATGKVAINYNRDIETFPVLKEILSQITQNQNFYNSPTNMGVNMAGFCISDDKVCQESAKQEIIRRYYRYLTENKKGLISYEVPERVKLLINELKIDLHDRKVIAPSFEKQKKTKTHCVAIELADGTIVTGKTQDIMTATAGCILNSLKYLCNIKDNITIIPAEILAPVLEFKQNILKLKNFALNLKDVLMALAISSATSKNSKNALQKVQNLKGCELHSTCILNQSDEFNLKNLGINLTCEPVFSGSDLFDF